MWILLNPPRQEIAMDAFGLADRTVVDWFSFCRQVCLDWCGDNSSRLGGPGRTVEIDEAKIGKSKYHRGRWIEGYWIFGGIERETGRVFVVQVPDRTKETLIAFIKHWIAEGTTIISDCWRAYDGLDLEGYVHFQVNHSENFVDPITGANTNRIERVWRDVRSTIPRYGTRKYHAEGYLAEYLFKRRFPNHTERIHHFFKAISTSFPPQNN